MREKLDAHLKRAGDADLEELPREALRRLAALARLRSRSQPGDLAQPGASALSYTEGGEPLMKRRCRALYSRAI